MPIPSHPPSFRQPDTLYLASSAEPDRQAASPAAAALFGAPLDLTETFRSGTHGGPAAVRYVSDALETYSPMLDRDLEDARLLDLGDLELQGLGMEACLEQIAGAMAHAATVARMGVMIGGEHTGSLGGYRGIKRVYPDAALVQLDAHLDIRASYDGEALTHASWVYHAGEEFGFSDVVQLGLRSGAREEWKRARERTAWSSTDLQMPPRVRARLEGRPIYLSVDIDVLDPAYAPGTGTPEPGGVTFRDLAACLYGMAGLRVVALDVMEVSPNLDAADITAAAGAKLIREAALLFGS